MADQPWTRIKPLLADTLRQPEHDRATYLSEHCEDPRLRAEVKRLLDGVSNLFPSTFIPADTSEVTDTAGAGKPSENDGGAETLPDWPKRFRLIRRLGSGGFGDVYHVTDTRDGSDVALKILRRVTPTTLYYFKREFQSLAAIRHEQLAGPYELINEGETWMFTMLFVDGVHFSEAFSRPPDPHQVRSLLRRLVHAVMALHEHGLLHRDIKPSNVLVTRAGQVVLVDFGLIRELHGWRPDTVTVAGTPVYMAPEQLKRAVLSEAADWYAVGVMTYQVITGRLPFEGDLLDVLFGKLNRADVSPAWIVPDLPRDLDTICTGLLRTDPDMRLSGRDVLALLSDATGPRALDQPAEVHPPTRPTFVGRRAELAAALEAFARSQQGTPQVLHVGGISGIGKSAFVDEFLRRARRADAKLVVLSGRCHQTESVPYQGIDEVVDALSRELHQMKPADVDVIAPRDFALLARLFPVLSKLGSASRPMARDAVDPVQSRLRAFLALREMLGRLAERHPVIVAIDDLQWADLDALAFVRDLMIPPMVPRLLFVLAYRADDGESAGRLGALRQLARDIVGYPETQCLDLAGLEPPDARALAESLVAGSSHDAALVASIVAEAAGSPFFVHELAQGAAVRTNDAMASNDGVTLQQIVSSRLERLSEVERDYLTCVAVAGRPTRVGVIERAARRATASLRSDLVAKRLLRVFSGAETLAVETYHDRIRDAILLSLADDERRDLHDRLATALEAEDDPDPERLAVHHEQAGHRVQAAAYAVVAARRATAALAFNNAALWYRQVLALGELSDDERRTMHAELGDVLSSAGRGAEAAREYVNAAKLSIGPSEMQLLSRAANQYLRAGHLREGVDLMEHVLGLVGIRLPTDRRRLLWRIGLERIRLWMQKRRRQPAPTSRADADYREVDVCAAATIGFSMVDPLRSAFFATRYVRLAVSLGEPYRLCLALASQATQLSHTSGVTAYPEVDRLLDEADQLAGQIASSHGRAFVMLMRSIVAYLRGRWALAVRHTDAALEILQTKCTGVAWEVCTAHSIGLVSRSATGEWARNASLLPALVQHAEALGDRYARHSLRVLGNGYVITLAADEPERARRELTADIEAWSYKYFDVQRASATLAEVDIALYEGDPARAKRKLDSEWPALVDSQLLRLPDTFVFSHLARGRTALALTVDSPADEKARHLADAAAAATRLRRRGPSWASGLALLLEAGIASADGQVAIMKEKLSLAEQALQAIGLTPYLMAARWRLAGTSSLSEHVQGDPSVHEWVLHQNIKRPERVFDALMPGRWPSSDGTAQRPGG